MKTGSDPLTLKLPLREKVAYGVGDFGSNLMLTIGTLYLLKFYTDELGMPAWYGGVIFLVAKFFTALTDMFTGIVLDSRRHIGTRGKFRPFILYFSLPVALVAAAQFVANDFSLTIKTTIATALFMTFGLFYSLMNCSYGAMVPAITKNPHERAHLAAWRQGGATVGLLVCTVCFMPIQSLFVGKSALGYQVAAAVFVVAGLLCMWFCYSGVKERYVELTPTHHKPGVATAFRAIFHNPPLLVLCLANLCTLAAFNIKLAIQVYYTQYVLNDVHLLSWMGFFSMGCILVGVLLMPTAVKQFGKKQVYLDSSSGPWAIWVTFSGEAALCCSSCSPAWRFSVRHSLTALIGRWCRIPSSTGSGKPAFGQKVPVTRATPSFARYPPRWRDFCPV